MGDRRDVFGIETGSKDLHDGVFCSHLFTRRSFQGGDERRRLRRLAKVTEREVARAQIVNSRKCEDVSSAKTREGLPNSSKDMGTAGSQAQEVHETRTLGPGILMGVKPMAITLSQHISKRTEKMTCVINRFEACPTKPSCNIESPV